MQVDKFNKPWKSGLFHLVSLLDMLKFCAKDFVVLMSELEGLIKALSADDPDFSVLGNNWDRITDILERTSQWCKLIELNASQELIDHIYFLRDEWTIKSLNEAKENIKTLLSVIRTELGKQLFLFVQNADAQWFERKDGFGKAVSDAFNSALKDIKEAGNCYATGHYNASIFHSMRVLECGLNVLAKELGITIKRESWGGVIGLIEKAIENEPNRERKEFFSGAALEFRFFKDAWRNHISHNRRDYDKFQALSVLNHVGAFMGHLATKIKE